MYIQYNDVVLGILIRLSCNISNILVERYPCFKSILVVISYIFVGKDLGDSSCIFVEKYLIYKSILMCFIYPSCISCILEYVYNV